MVDKTKLIEQTNLAFDFIQKLYLEISYMIKEAEAMYNEEPEKFVIGKPGGYQVSIRSSSGLEAMNVNLWLFRKFAVFFVPEEETQVKGGQQSTSFSDKLKVIYMRFVLQDRIVNEPAVFSGVLYNIKDKRKGQWPEKFEHCMAHFGYVDDKLFRNPSEIEYEDVYISLNGELLQVNLYDINNSESIREQIVNPTLELFRKH